MDNFDKIAQETVQTVQALPFDIVHHGKGQLCKRSIWMDFCKQVDQDEAFNDEGSYAVEAVRTITAFLVEDWIDELYKDGNQLRSTWCCAPLSDKYDGVDYDDVDSEIIQTEFEEIVYSRVVRVAQQARNKKGYQRTKKFDRFAFFPTFQEIFTSRAIWGVEQDHKIEPIPLSPAEECRKTCQKILGIKEEKEQRLVGLARQATEAKGEYKTLPFVIDGAIQKACQSEHYETVVEFTLALREGKKGVKNGYQPNWDLIHFADPSIFFGFAREPIFNYANASKFVDEAQEILNEECPNREKQVAELLLSVVRRLTGDQDAVYPLLYGEPGTGKTFLVEQLAAAFTEAGLKTDYIHQPMTGNNVRGSNEAAMSLEGITSRWANAKHGTLYDKVFLPTSRLCLVALDEIDKCDVHDWLVTLLDPRQPVQDALWRDFFTTIDMRHKSIFFSTANNVEIIRKGGAAPLWSRLGPIETPPYTVSETIELVTKLVSKRQQDIHLFASDNEVIRITEQIVYQYQGRALPSVRALLDQVKRQLHLRQYPGLERILAAQRDEYKAPQGIGFAVTKG